MNHFFEVVVTGIKQHMFVFLNFLHCVSNESRVPFRYACWIVRAVFYVLTILHVRVQLRVTLR